MRSSRLSLALLSLASSVLADSPCRQRCPSELAQYPPAQSFCSSLFPSSGDTTTVTATATEINTPVTVTVTATVVTITSTIGTNTVLLTVTPPVTEIDVTGTDTATITDSTQVVTDITTVITDVVYTTTATILITTDKLNVKRTVEHLDSIPVPTRHPILQDRAHLAAHARDFRRSPVDPLASLFSSLTSQPASVIQSACSCIETKPPIDIITATVTVTEGGGATTDDVTETTTALVEATVTVSVTPVVTIFTAVTATVSVVQTLTKDIDETVTVSAATTVTQYTVIPTPSCTPGNQFAGGSFNCEFAVTCGQRIVSASPGEVPIVLNGITNMSQCLLDCSDNAICNAFSFNSIDSTCTLWTNSSPSGGSVTPAPDEYSIFGIYTGTCQPN